MLPPTLIKASPRIFLGPTPDLLDVPPQATLISLVPTQAMPEGQLCLPLADTLLPTGIPDRATVEAFMRDAHAAVERGPTYWHCHRGINRSGFVLAAYLHLFRRQRISAAVARLRRLRSPIVLQNAAFVAALNEWYAEPDESVPEVDMEAVARVLGVATVPRHLRQPLPMPERQGGAESIDVPWNPVE